MFMRHKKVNWKGGGEVTKRRQRGREGNSRVREKRERDRGRKKERKGEKVFREGRQE